MLSVSQLRSQKLIELPNRRTLVAANIWVSLYHFLEKGLCHTKQLSGFWQEQPKPLIVSVMHTRETDVLRPQKPIAMQLFERWVIVSVIAWSLLSLSYGVTFVGIVEGIALPLMALFMFFVGRWMLFVILIVQKRNSAISRKLWDLVIYFFWGGSIFSFFYFLVSGVFASEENYTYFLIAVSPFALGPALGASKMWEQRFEYK